MGAGQVAGWPSPVVSWRPAVGQQDGLPPLLVMLHGHRATEAYMRPLAAALPASLTVAAVRGPLLERGGYAWFVGQSAGRPDPGSLHAAVRWLRAWLDGLSAQAAGGGIRSGQAGPGTRPSGDTWTRQAGPETRTAGDAQTVHPRALHPFDPTRVVVLGFSGGAALAAALALDDPARWAGVILLSGTVPFDVGLPTTPGRLDGLRVFLAHGNADTVIPADLVTRTARYLKGPSGALVSAHRYPIGHEVSPGELAEIGTWLERTLTLPPAG